MSSSTRLETSEIARKELSAFLGTARSAGLDSEHQRRLLRLSHDDWGQWLGVLDDKPLPSEASVPLLLRHLGYLTSRLDRAGRMPQT